MSTPSALPIDSTTLPEDDFEFVGSSPTSTANHQLQLKHDEITSLKAEIDRLSAEVRLANGTTAEAVDDRDRLKLLLSKEKESRKKDESELRTVEIRKIDGLIGIRGHGPFIQDIVAGGPADIHGGLRIGDQMIQVNGVNVGLMCADEIHEIMDRDAESVKLLVLYNPECLNHFDFIAGNHSDLKAKNRQLSRDKETSMELVERQRVEIRLAKEETAKALEEVERMKLLLTEQREGNKDEDAIGELRSVEVHKDKVTDKIGIRFFGSSILRIRAGEPADLQGELRSGDQMIEVNGVNVERMSGDEIEEIMDSDPVMTRFIVRHNPERLVRIIEDVAFGDELCYLDKDSSEEEIAVKNERSCLEYVGLGVLILLVVILLIACVSKQFV